MSPHRARPAPEVERRPSLPRIGRGTRRARRAARAHGSSCTGGAAPATRRLRARLRRCRGRVRSRPRRGLAPHRLRAPGGAVAAAPESPLHLVLAVSPLKGDRMELVLQKTTELGVAEIWPVVTDRTDAAARPALDGTRVERWERVASGAAEQCGRAVVPRVADTTTLEALLAKPFDGTRIVLLETRAIPRCRRSRSRRAQAAAAARRSSRRLRAARKRGLLRGRRLPAPRRSALGSCARRRQPSPRSRSLRRPGAICASSLRSALGAG